MYIGRIVNVQLTVMVTEGEDIGYRRVNITPISDVELESVLKTVDGKDYLDVKDLKIEISEAQMRMVDTEI